jgi:choline dehydrogenase-like flavoprotein
MSSSAKTSVSKRAKPQPKSDTIDFTEQVGVNQKKLATGLEPHYDFIVCGSGSSGSVVARRLAENPAVSVLLLEAGGSDDVPSVMEANQWPLNIGSERDWSFSGTHSSHLNGRCMRLPMGKVWGGGSSINVMIWSHGHKNDWDFFAAEVADTAWNYESVLNIYRRIEDWHGVPDPKYYGTGGPVFVQPAPDPNPVALAMLEGARSSGIPRFENQNGSMMESGGGCSIHDMQVRDGNRQSIFRSYVYPYRNRANITVLTHALVSRVIFEGKRATGVEVIYEEKTHSINARYEVVLSLGAIHTPKVLMQSGIGDQAELERFGIPLVQHLPGVGRNFQDHFAISCIWEYPQPVAPHNNACEATFFAKSDSSLDTPDLQPCLIELPVCTPEITAQFNPPPGSWTLFAAVVRPKSRGQIHLTGRNPQDPLQIAPNTLSHPDDLKAAIASIRLCREIGNSLPLRPFVNREVAPGNLEGPALEKFVRDSAMSYAHQTSTAKMGRDAMSVVDGQLKVYGVDNLRIADASIMPRVTTGNTMAPSVVIGERAGEILKVAHRMS